MEFNVLAFFFTIGCCLISWIIAGRTAIKPEYKEWFEKLNRACQIFCVNGKISLERNPFFSKLNGKLV